MWKLCAVLLKSIMSFLKIMEYFCKDINLSLVGEARNSSKTKDRTGDGLVVASPLLSVSLLSLDLQAYCYYLGATLTITSHLDITRISSPFQMCFLKQCRNGEADGDWEEK